MAKTGFELAIFVPNLEEKVANAELPKAINLQPQRTTTNVEDVVEINENLLVILVVEDAETEMVAIALETAEKNVCKIRGK